MTANSKHFFQPDEDTFTDAEESQCKLYQSLQEDISLTEANYEPYSNVDFRIEQPYQKLQLLASPSDAWNRKVEFVTSAFIPQKQPAVELDNVEKNVHTMNRQLREDDERGKKTDHAERDDKEINEGKDCKETHEKSIKAKRPKTSRTKSVPSRIIVIIGLFFLIPQTNASSVLEDCRNDEILITQDQVYGTFLKKDTERGKLRNNNTGEEYVCTLHGQKWESNYPNIVNCTAYNSMVTIAVTKKMLPNELWILKSTNSSSGEIISQCSKRKERKINPTPPADPRNTGTMTKGGILLYVILALVVSICLNG